MSGYSHHWVRVEDATDHQQTLNSDMTLTTFINLGAGPAQVLFTRYAARPEHNLAQIKAPGDKGLGLIVHGPGADILYAELDQITHRHE